MILWVILANYQIWGVMETPKCVATWSVVQAAWGSLELVAGIKNRNILVMTATLACGVYTNSR